ncbi:MAG: CAP domain-containing protein [Myxococcales bacterium]|nr:CAP domain-containing protein [Myxococcales bacterium]
MTGGPRGALWALCLLPLAASAWADAARQDVECRDDAQLSQAAAELLLEAAEPAPSALEAALRRAGSDLVGVKLLYVPAAADEPSDWRRKLDDGRHGTPVCGRASGERASVLLYASRGGSLEVVGPEPGRLRGSLEAGFSRPQLIIANASGQLERLAPSLQQLRRGIPIAAELERPARIQLLAAGPDGPRPVAERLLPALEGQGVDPAQSWFHGEGGDPHDRLEQLRSAAGRSPLRSNRLLEDVARKHAKSVCDSGRVAHQLEAGGDPEQRLRAAGIRARRVGETVARAGSAAAAFDAFERSPSHRLTLLEPDFTDVGIGQAQRGDRSCLVVLTATWPHYVGR